MIAQIEHQRASTQQTFALQRRIGGFRSKDFYFENVLCDGNLDSGGSCDADPRALIQIYLPAGRNKLTRRPSTSGCEVPLASVHIHDRVRCIKQRVLFKMHRTALHNDLRAQGELRAYDELRGIRLG